ncbi:hypothetical protein [Paracoccus alkanivorans]|uniref:Uncharacterized protein n=1 Tax=Paracoccus alkanivorans TaxID=2116655 RepID=A0A3M0LY71_9RHOB|nr:hypothetical protein [Paracoccus alkanivorans]RMC30115.1 hypothetical protein C9E81_22015 [Paracoccus alkanivorans]
MVKNIEQPDFNFAYAELQLSISTPINNQLAFFAWTLACFTAWQIYNGRHNSKLFRKGISNAWAVIIPIGMVALLVSIIVGFFARVALLQYVEMLKMGVFYDPVKGVFDYAPGVKEISRRYNFLTATQAVLVGVYMLVVCIWAFLHLRWFAFRAEGG